MEEFTVQFLRERSTIFGQNEIPALFVMPAFLATSDKLPALPALARHAAKPILESRKFKNTFVFKMFSFSGGFAAAAPGCPEIAIGGIDQVGLLLALVFQWRASNKKLSNEVVGTGDDIRQMKF